MTYMLGRKAVKRDPRTLRLARYMDPSILPTPPNQLDWTTSVNSWPMDLNDTLGDCVIAGMAHCVQLWTTVLGNPKIWSDAEVLALYEQLGGYNPNDPSTDNGCVELDVLNAWQNTGCNGDQLMAFAAIDPTNQTEVEQTIQLLGVGYLGVGLPISAQNQIGTLWDIPSDFDFSGDNAIGSWGGHCVPIMAYDEQTLTCITWGQPQKMTWDWLSTYCDEAYALLDMDWINNSGVNPQGFNLSELQADLAALPKPPN